MPNALRGLLSPPRNALEAEYPPVTANQNMLAQSLAARQQPRGILSGPDNWYEAAQSAGMVPGLGMLSVAGDIGQYLDKPETRNALNYGLTALGSLPALGIAKQAIFAGMLAKTADIPKKQMAEVMEKAGMPRDDIWKETGWFKGPEGKWKFEIDDSAAQFNRGMPTWGRLHENAPIEKTFKHDNLYQAYPDVAKFKLSPLGEKSGNVAGSFDNGAISIEAQLNKNHQNKIASTTLHELQHGVQRTEGFPRGGNPDQMAIEWSLAKDKMDFDTTVAALVREAEASTNGYIDEAARLLNGIGFDVSRAHIDRAMSIGTAEAIKIADESENALRKYGDLGVRGSGDPGDQLYRRLAGEAEARAVQSRMNMNPAQRQATPPWQSYDVPWDRLIIK